MRPAPTASQWGLASIVCGGGAFLAAVLSVAPFVGCLATPLAGLGSLAAIVLGIVAIVDGGKRGDPAERLRGVVGVVLGVTLPVLLAGALFFSRFVRQSFAAPPPAPVVVPADAGP